MNKIIVAEYDGAEVTFTDEGWFDATSVAKRYGKRPADWLKNADTKDYLKALAKALGISDPRSLIRAKRNSGTSMHPKLGVRFAQWLDVDFAVWCDLQIDKLLRGQTLDWKRCRHEAASSYKVMGEVLQMTRDAAGKKSAPHHYMNEARLVNQAITGEFKGLNRESLSSLELDLLAKLEVKNAALIAMGHEYAERKVKLTAFVEAWKSAHPSMLQLQKAA